MRPLIKLIGAAVLLLLFSGCAGVTPQVNERVDSFTGATDISTDFSIVYDEDKFITQLSLSYAYSTSLSDTSMFAIDVLVDDIVNIDKFKVNVGGDIYSLKPLKFNTNHPANKSARRYVISRALMEKMINSPSVKIRVTTLDFHTYDGDFTSVWMGFDAKTAMISFLEKVDKVAPKRKYTAKPVNQSVIEAKKSEPVDETERLMRERGWDSQADEYRKERGGE